MQSLLESILHPTDKSEAVVSAAVSLSRAELSHLASTVAEAMSDACRPREPVVICLRRSTEVVASVLGALISGHPFVLIDANGPVDRLRRILDDVAPAMVVGRLPDGVRWKGRALSVPINEAAGRSAPADSVPDGAIAYIAYTSGSTGKPKGVEVSRRSLATFVRAMARTTGVTIEDRWLAVTPFGFDIALAEALVPLAVGGSTVLASEDDILFPRRLVNWMRKSRATILQGTPSMWRRMLLGGWKGETRVVIGGEALPPNLAKQLLVHAPSLLNMYGPTETTVWATAAIIDNSNFGNPPIGRPLANTHVHVLDSELRPVPAGAVGEIGIAGAGVAIGYRNLAQETADRFVAWGLSHVGPERLYRTGDQGRINESGQLEYLGRVDRQVKIAGIRVELGEVEAALHRQGSVRQAAVVAIDRGDGRQHLAAVVVPQNAEGFDRFALQKDLRRDLPPPAIPSLIIVSRDLPLTPAGKTDYKLIAETTRTASEAETHRSDAVSTN